MNPLWYYRHEHQTVGPVPFRALERYVVLGRLGPEDLVSPDNAGWMKIRDCPEFSGALRISGEEASLARRYADERNLDRRSRSGNSADEHRQGDRRHEESPEITGARLQRASLFVHKKERSWLVYVLVASLILLVALALLFYRPVNPIPVGLFR